MKPKAWLYLWNEEAQEWRELPMNSVENAVFWRDYYNSVGKSAEYIAW